MYTDMISNNYPVLERWIQFGDCLVGYLFNHREFPDGTRVITQAIRFVDPINFHAECADGTYKLGEPGSPEEHNQPLIKKRKVIIFPGKKLETDGAGGPRDAS